MTCAVCGARWTADVDQCPTDHAAEIDRCVCDPEGPCLGVPGESDSCGACLVLDPEEPCLHDPEVEVDDWDEQPFPPAKRGEA